MLVLHTYSMVLKQTCIKLDLLVLPSYSIETNVYETKYISSMVFKQICMNLHMLVLPSYSMVLKQTFMNLHM